ncbi:sugar phosphate isomerase/epimerase [Phyllobacterium sp. YR531]|uniref:sugar phosphate isomerase/epimerase family protein n=1 Tax=Phyllobacterium sp. YR531 TaxID=1144343 RepID=UPI00026FBA93|nr:sugar phosphate isomerase/epimerase [Phyllobacterium sp. YR531]EJN05869.1 sugar phosphate isomerase/epimerase [Phyllobacterium sp. YR531]
MKIGLNTDGFGALSLESCLDHVAQLGLTCVEFGVGGWSSAPHLNIGDLLQSARARDALLGMLRERNLEISALNCSGNQLHPGNIGSQDTDLAYKTIELASLLGVGRIVMMSGLPAGGPGDKHPNWITSSWPLEAMEILEWQWSERVIPFWKQFAKLAEAKSLRICVEQHGRQAVYNVESFFRLREAVGETVGVNFDPSHLIWMGGDPISAISALGECIYHVHGKDSRVELQARVDGLLDPKHVTPVGGRSWNFVSLGHGTAVRGWLDIIRALKGVGYADVISIENEDYSMTATDAISTSVNTLRFCIDNA